MKCILGSNCVICNNYTMVCPPVRRDNPRALASGLSPVQAEIPWYYCFYHSYQCRPVSAYLVLNFAISGKEGINIYKYPAKILLRSLVKTNFK